MPRSALNSFGWINQLLRTNKPYLLVLWTNIGLTAGFHSGNISVMFGLCWSEMSVFGSQVFVLAQISKILHGPFCFDLSNGVVQSCLSVIHSKEVKCDVSLHCVSQ